MITPFAPQSRCGILPQSHSRQRRKKGAGSLFYNKRNVLSRFPRLVLTLLALLCLTPPSFANSWVDAFGPSRPLYSLGFGGVVAGIDPTGRIETLLYPHSGGFNQLPAPLADKTAPYGCQWGVVDGQDTAWLSQATWTNENTRPPSPETAALEIISTSATLKARATQTFIVSPKNCALAVRIQLDPPEPVRTISWFQQFTPVPFDRLPLALPIPLPDASRGFASFFDPQRTRIYQFRPAHPGRQDWDRARRLQQDRATPAEWSSFQDGAWCATAFSTREITCEFHNAENRADTTLSAVGRAAALVHIAPAAGGAANRAEVFIAFGKNREEVDKALDTVLQAGFDALQSETQTEYEALLAPAVSHVGDTPGARERLFRDLKVLLSALDPNSGTVAAAPAHQPPVSATRPELCAWTALAWHLSGYPDQAKRQLQFFHDPLLATEDSVKPPVGFPELLRTDGKPALPAFVRNPASAGWMVLAVVQLLRHSPPDSAAADAATYYTELVLPAMHYLRRWASPASGGPSPGFDTLLLRDTGSVSNELLYYLAVEGAAEVATLANRSPEPDWQSWQRQLDALLRFRIVNEPAGWDISPTLAAWTAMTLAPTNTLCKAFMRTGSGVIALGDCPIPALPPDRAFATPTTLESATDLVALLSPQHPSPPKP